ncbi:MAG: serine/threonine-protein kinase [Croceibacterium sp.]
MAQIFFDDEQLRKGDYVNVSEILSGSSAQYELGEWIARGGNAAVYACRDRATGAEYAVKFLMNSGWRVARRFIREARLMKALAHEHVISLVDDGQAPIQGKSGRLPFIIMERADGNLHQAMCEEGHRYAPEVYIAQFRGLAQALAEMHRHAVHRDIKPENILIFGDRWTLADYGLCRFVDGRDGDISGDRFVQGPRFWLSPESQNRRLGNADEIAPASDVYQLAAVFWFIVTGRHPSGILTRDDWTGPEWLFDPVFVSLQHDMRRRPQNGNELVASFEEALAKA